ncbi:hypothetical protein [Novipirellula artificiosorum]|uniref:Uncharacterized protein n=1 Tax=Novipirellula artificiosorum TaxID=2528016 RepID=A0A5C6D487_9BACT|nr:hypothetical protein [Novipirellula artificiosorum]TWU31610.1 hypothetical protein Poly41_61670 [Novipirellula artificiosorum]
MIVNSFQIDETVQLKPLSLEELSEARTKADARIWIDLEGFEPSEFEDWLDKLSTTDKAFFKLADARDFMNCALANLKSAERTLD